MPKKEFSRKSREEAATVWLNYSKVRDQSDLPVNIIEVKFGLNVPLRLVLREWRGDKRSISRTEIS